MGVVGVDGGIVVCEFSDHKIFSELAEAIEQFLLTRAAVAARDSEQ